MRKIKLTVFALTSVLALASCSGLTSNTDMKTKEGIESVAQMIKDNFGDKQICDINLYAQDHLEESFGFMNVNYLDNGVTKTQSYHDMNDVGLGDPEEETSFPYDEKKDGLIKGSDIDLSFVPAKFDEAVKQIQELSDEYEGFVLNSISLDIDKDGKFYGDMTLEGTKKGEGTSLEGRNIVTNYYEFDFDLNADGTVELDE